MEKIIYLAQLSAGADCDSFRRQALDTLSRQLLEQADVLKMCMHFADSDVDRAKARTLQQREPLPQFMLSLWVHSAYRQRQFIELLAPWFPRIEGYLVCESEILMPPSQPGERTIGSTQICTFRKKPDITQQDFIRRWRFGHTPIAVQTQSTFGYRQNLVVARLTEETLDHSAIVEEHFPTAAMDSAEVFFNAEGDPKRLQKHQQMMAESCAHFIDPTSINVIHMSEYCLKQ